MTIKTGVGTGVIEVLAADTTILAVTDRVDISACNCQNTTAATVSITFYISPDLTSAAGKEVATLSLAASESQDVGEIIGEGYKALENIIAVGSVAGINCTTTFIQYSGDDI